MIQFEHKPDPGGAAAEADTGDGVADRLRRRREQLAKASTRLFDVPGYGGELVGRYRRLTYEELRAVLFEGDDDVVGRNCAFLIATCEELLFREPDGTFRPLVEGVQVGYDFRLGEGASGASLGTVLGLDNLPSIREQMIAAFGDSDLRVNEHSGEVHRWMIELNEDDDDSLVADLGEA